MVCLQSHPRVPKKDLMQLVPEGLGLSLTAYLGLSLWYHPGQSQLLDYHLQKNYLNYYERHLSQTEMPCKSNYRTQD